MYTEEGLKLIIDDQQIKYVAQNKIPREERVNFLSKRILIITGVRRCGKSTFMNQLYNLDEMCLVNFEDPRLEGFELSDFQKIENLFIRSNKQVLLFDEIQNIPEWEKYARSAHDRGLKLCITGSNASMLSKELGTRLTGRYVQKELFPFSYTEYCTYIRQETDAESFQGYMKNGGFPEYLLEQDAEYLRTLMKDIILRDIVVRRGIRNEHFLIRLAVHLFSNVGKEFSYNNLTKTLEIKSVRTTIDYCDYLQECYLLDLVPRFSFSIHQQLANPKKVYSIDTAMAKANSISFSNDIGRMLENAVFLFLRRKYNEIYYYKNDRMECDFLIKENEKITLAIQVCSYVTPENMKRELLGLQTAMRDTGCSQGLIITLDQEDVLNGVHLIPAWKWMSV